MIHVEFVSETVEIQITVMHMQFKKKKGGSEKKSFCRRNIMFFHWDIKVILVFFFLASR